MATATALEDDRNDASLVGRARDVRDLGAFAELVRRHHAMVFAGGLTVAGDRALAEDAAQEAFVHAWQHLDQLRDPSRFAPWLFAIVRNVARAAMRKRSRELPDTDHEVAAATTPLSDLMAQEADVALAQLLRRVPDRYRAPMVLHYAAGHSVSQISRCLGLSEANVKKLLSRGREILRDRAQRFSELAGACRVPATLGSAVMVAVASSNAAHAAQATTTSGALAHIFASGVVMKKILVLVAAVVACGVLVALGLWPEPVRSHGGLDGTASPVSRLETRAAPGKTLRISGLVVDDGTSMPIAGAVVVVTRAQLDFAALEVVSADHRDPSEVAVTDAHGRFSLLSYSGQFHVSANAPGWIAPIMSAAMPPGGLSCVAFARSAMP